MHILRSSLYFPGSNKCGISQGHYVIMCLELHVRKLKGGLHTKLNQETKTLVQASLKKMSPPQKSQRSQARHMSRYSDMLGMHPNSWPTTLSHRLWLWECVLNSWKMRDCFQMDHGVCRYGSKPESISLHPTVGMALKDSGQAMLEGVTEDPSTSEMEAWGLWALTSLSPGGLWDSALE